MDEEQVLKQLDWLDEERRKDKTILSSLQDRTSNLEEKFEVISKQLNELSIEVSKMNVLFNRLDSVETSMANTKIDFGKKIDQIDKKLKDEFEKAEKTRKSDVQSLSTRIDDLYEREKEISEINKSLNKQKEEEFRLSKLVEDLNKKFTTFDHENEEMIRNHRILEENRRQDSKRITDLQAELIAVRKRAEEHRGKLDLASDGLRRLEVKTNEIQVAETERKQEQNAFIELQNRNQVERDRTWKNWENMFAEINTKAQKLDVEIQALDSTQRALKRSQDAFDEITESFNRRVNEITEMQRLTEERFRNEWNSHKSDELKRWTNYSMEQDEKISDIERSLQKQDLRTENLEGSIQNASDRIQLILQNLKRSYILLQNASNDWLNDHNQNFE